MKCWVCKNEFFFSARDCLQECLRRLDPLLEHSGLVTRWYMFRDRHEKAGVPIPRLAEGDDAGAFNAKSILQLGVVATHGVCGSCFMVANETVEDDGAEADSDGNLTVEGFIKALQDDHAYRDKVGAASRARQRQKEASLDKTRRPRG
jgi:hypothetical protein